MCPSDSVWEAYIKERKLNTSIQRLRANANEIEFPNPSEGFDKIYEVINNNIKLRMDELNPEIVDSARKELSEESQQIKQEEEKAKERLDLLKSMNSRPFWHYCEVCGAKVFCTAQDAFDAGWDYPPQLGRFGLLGPRTCGECDITSTLYWKVQQQAMPIVIESTLTKEELKTNQKACCNKLCIIKTVKDMLYVNQMFDREGLTEQLKVDNQKEWNVWIINIRSRVTEIVSHNIIYY